jgi:hypothetical protein
MAQPLDLYHDYQANFTVKPISLTTANANGVGVDLLNARGALMIATLGVSGAAMDATNKVTVAFVESTDNSTFTAIADTDLIGGNNTSVHDANAEANNTVARSYIGKARYVAINFNVGGTIALPVAGTIVRGKKLRA